MSIYKVHRQKTKPTPKAPELSTSVCHLDWHKTLLGLVCNWETFHKEHCTDIYTDLLLSLSVL